MKNRKELVAFVKHQIDLDLDKLAEEKQSKPRTFLGIDVRGEYPSKINHLKELLNKAEIRYEDNGVVGKMAIFYKR